jgi:TolB protein
MDADRPAIVPPEETVPQDVVLQSFIGDSRGRRAWLASLSRMLRRLLRRGPLLMIAVLAAAAEPASSRSDASVATGRIAYSERFAGPDSWEIFVVGVDGRGSRNLTRNPRCDEHSPEWSPDGTTIAYRCSSTSSSKAALYLMRSDGSGKRPLGQAGDGWSPSWSPDGRTIAFARNERIFTVRTDGSDLRRLTSGTPGTSTPAWSHDGKLLAYSRQRGATQDIWIASPDGTGARLLTRGGTGPRWSPDGRKIAFEIPFPRDGSAGGIYVMNVDGSRRRLVHDDGTDPSWSPDSTQIAFQRIGQPIPTEGIWVMNADGTRRRMVIKASQPGGVAWQPSR